MDGKGYQAAVQDVFKNTAVKGSDIDPKAVQLLDALEAAGKAEEACAHLSKSLEGVAREKVENWKAYVFTLLRAFDSEVYNNMKEQRGRPKPRRNAKETTKVVGAFNFRSEAVEFVPGSGAWNGSGMSAAAAAEAPAPAASESTPAPAASPAPANATNGAGPTAAAPAAEPPAAVEAPAGTVFQVEYSGTQPGEVLAAIGGAAELGSWDPSKALPLTTSESTYPVWKSAGVALAKGTEVEYKYVVLGADKAVARWEPIEGNRKLTAGSDPGLAKFGSL